jgi:hypothetical protein
LQTETFRLANSHRFGLTLADGVVSRHVPHQPSQDGPLGLVPKARRGHPLRAKFAQLPGFTRQALAVWAAAALGPGTTAVSDGLACFAGVTDAECFHEPLIVSGRKPKEVPLLHWVNTVLGNVKSGLSGAYHAFDFGKDAERYLGAIAYL